MNIYFLSAVSSENNQAFLGKPGLQDLFSEIISVRYGRCGFDNVHLMKALQCEGECEENKILVT